MRARPGVVAAAGLALVAVLVVGILIGRSGDSGSAPSPTPTTVPVTVPPGQAADPPSAAPTLGPVDTVMYELPGGIRVPHSPTAGPAHTENHLASGFAHTPLGAVMAGINIEARAAASMGEPIYRPTLERQVIGDEQPTLLRLIHEEGRPDIPGPNERSEGANVRIYGFIIDSYSPTEAKISYLMTLVQDGQQKYVAYQFTVRREDGDWKLVAPPNADFSMVARVVNGTDQFLPFT